MLAQCILGLVHSARSNPKLPLSSCRLAFFLFSWCSTVAKAMSFWLNNFDIVRRLLINGVTL